MLEQLRGVPEPFDAHARDTSHEGRGVIAVLQDDAKEGSRARQVLDGVALSMEKAGGIADQGSLQDYLELAEVRLASAREEITRAVARGNTPNGAAELQELDRIRALIALELHEGGIVH